MDTICLGVVLLKETRVTLPLEGKFSTSHCQGCSFGAQVILHFVNFIVC